MSMDELAQTTIPPVEQMLLQKTAETIALMVERHIGHNPHYHKEQGFDGCPAAIAAEIRKAFA